MKQYDKEILKRLIDKYEGSLSFIGANSVTQSFSISLEKEFPEYGNDANVTEIQEINNAVDDLYNKGLALPKHRKNGILYSVQLNRDNIENGYKFLKRKPKKDLNNELLSILAIYQEGDDIVSQFCKKQIVRIAENKKPEHFNGSVQDYANLLKGLHEVTKVQQETFERDFSVRVFGDSKAFGNIKGTIVSILNEYGDFPEQGAVLEDLNIVKNPGHVYFKGKGLIEISRQEIDLSNMNGDIAVSSTLLKNIDYIKVKGDSVVTIENLTTFNSFKPQNQFVIYLGGYHNSIRREFIKKLYSDNPNINYFHYGDIDAGGFYILLHLREKTGVDFKPLNMDVETLLTNAEYVKSLTDNDRKRLKNLLGGEFNDVVEYMLEHNCKLEQEVLDQKLEHKVKVNEK